MPEPRPEGLFTTRSSPSSPAKPMTLLPPPSMFVAFQQPRLRITPPNSCKVMPSLYFDCRPSTTTSHMTCPVRSTPMAVRGCCGPPGGTTTTPSRTICWNPAIPSATVPSPGTSSRKTRPRSSAQTDAPPGPAGLLTCLPETANPWISTACPSNQLRSLLPAASGILSQGFAFTKARTDRSPTSLRGSVSAASAGPFPSGSAATTTAGCILLLVRSTRRICTRFGRGSLSS